MGADKPNLDFYLLQALEGAEKGKKHLKTATKEILLAAKSISHTLSSLSIDPDFHRNYPKLSQLLQFGISTVNEIAERIQSERKNIRKKKTNGKTRKRKKAANH